MTHQLADGAERRPLASRQRRVFQRLAAALAAGRVPPNAISIASVVFGVAACTTLVLTAQSEAFGLRLFWFASAALIQLRLLANMLDGMVAIEGDLASPLGELYNEVPDRISDSAILIGAGYALGSAPWLGYIAAIAALFVAYVRAFGASVGAGQAFHGPMAKPHRMFILTVACLFCGIAPQTWQPQAEGAVPGVVGGTLVIIIVGGIITALRRLRFIASAVRNRAS